MEPRPLKQVISEWRENETKGVEAFNAEWGWRQVPIEERIRFLEWRLLQALGALANVADAVIAMEPEKETHPAP